MSDGESFESYIARERERLDHEHREVTQQIRELESRLTEIQRERVAVTAYEDAKRGRSAPHQIRGERKIRQGSRREELLSLIRDNPGLTRGGILEKMGLRGDKAGEMSISNALTALTKNSKVRREGRAYHIG